MPVRNEPVRNVVLEGLGVDGQPYTLFDVGRHAMQFQKLRVSDVTGNGLRFWDVEIGSQRYSMTEGLGFGLVLSGESAQGPLAVVVAKDDGGRVRANYSTPGDCFDCMTYENARIDPGAPGCSSSCGGCSCTECRRVSCGGDDPEGDIDPEDPWETGWNSPVVDGATIGGLAFHELSLSGEPNAAGLALTARDDDGFEVRDAAGNEYRIHVAGTRLTSFWAGAKDRVRTYELTVTSATDPEPRPLCAGGRNEAILFTGDRYDAAKRTVTATGAETAGWINIACAGTAPAKLYLLRHTEESQQVVTSRAERQAMLKMLAADVYGDGTPFTVAGQPLLWQDVKGITTYPSTPQSVEALWSENGAVCLNEPRRRDQAAAIDSHGNRPPRCTEQMLKTPGLGYVISAHPRS